MGMPKGKATSAAALVAILLILTTLSGECLAHLEVGFYAGKCGKHNVESIVFNIMKAKFAKDRTIVPALLRMQYHDCFVKGCDASILLDGRKTEKSSVANEHVRGYHVIDAVKAVFEKACPRVVSCADIIAIATRAAVVLAGGISYNVETGRKDGRVSLASKADSIPGPTMNVSSTVQDFAVKGLSKEDFVLLLDAHTIGKAQCKLFKDRLYNFGGVSGKTDPSMNHMLEPFLKRSCPRNGNGRKFVFLDQSGRSSANIIDNGFFKALVERKGILQIDQSVALDPSTKDIVSKYASNNALFQTRFGQAMVKLGRVGVLTGIQGNVRKSCRRTY